MWKKNNLVYSAIILAPIIINYGLFTWRGPYVYGESSQWLGFFANYLGFLGAVGIAIIQFKNQKQSDYQKDRESRLLWHMNLKHR